MDMRLDEEQRMTLDVFTDFFAIVLYCPAVIAEVVSDLLVYCKPLTMISKAIK